MHSRRQIWCAGLAVGLLAGACAKNPVTGGRELSLVSKEQEIALGKQAAEEVRQSIGLYQDPELNRYVQELGMRLAATSERPDLPWQFGVVDDASVNAFALPGGPIFVTRGILTHLHSEAELAAVVGHEIGHVAAKHSVSQLSKAQLAQLGLVVGVLVKPELARWANAAGAGMQLLFLKNGRDAERQADELGFKYMLQHRYDPSAMASTFQTLGRVAAGSNAGRLPEWLSTHPDPSNRVRATQDRIAHLEPKPTGLTVDQDKYLGRLEGMVFGEDPRQGYFQGSTFFHPTMKFRMDWPQGWQAQNLPQAVMAASPNQDAMLQLAVAPPGMSPQQALQQFVTQEVWWPGW
jgi:predicted Zn-dependent protease